MAEAVKRRRRRRVRRASIYALTDAIVNGVWDGVPKTHIDRMLAELAKLTGAGRS